jgi:hypothetical protein
MLLGKKEKIMRSSYGETSGFTAVGAEELLLVNGGKGGSSGGGGSSKSSTPSSTPKSSNNSSNTKGSSTTTKTTTITYQPPAPVTSKPKTFDYDISGNDQGAKGSVTVSKGNVSLTGKASVSGSYTPPVTVKVDPKSVSVGFVVGFKL